jgi:alpha-tubulin suppressor-like RCC1 family protein
VCHGVDGTDGVDGIDGSSNLLRATNAAWGGVCAFGGVKLDTGVDLNANGVLDDAEVTQTQYVCNRSLSSFSAIATGHSTTCGILTGGTLACWGNNGDGQLGNGTLIAKYTPVAVIGMGSGVAQVALGTSHVCAVKTDGSAWCWGGNAFGQLGDGTNTRRTAPVAVSGLASGVSKMTAFVNHTCAVKLDGSAWCWGDNASGQLGDGSTTNRNTPTAVNGLASGVTLVSAGGAHACAIKSDGSAWCWGSNTDGHL